MRYHYGDNMAWANPVSDYILDAGGQQMSEYTMQANWTMAWQHTNVWAAGRLLATYSQITISGTPTALLHF
ncbi:MAG: hypothetical protein ACRD3N_09740 [Terracidiphilus sp.]